MPPAETLLSAIVVVLPLWLGIVRYVVSEVEFRNHSEANRTVVVIFAILFLILYALLSVVEQLSNQHPSLEAALYALFAALGLTGLGGIMLIFREVELVTRELVLRIPAAIVLANGMYLVLRLVFPTTSKTLVFSIASVVSFAYVLYIMRALGNLADQFIRSYE